MNSMLVVGAITGVVAIAAAMLAWIAIDIGTVTLKRYRAHFTERTKFQIDEFFLFIDVKKLFLVNLSLMSLAAVATYAVTGTVLLAVPVFFACALAPRLLYAYMRQRRLDMFEYQLPDALMMLAGGARAGVAVNAAIAQMVGEAPAPVGQEFSLLLREQRLGVTMEQSLNNLGRRMPTQSTALVVSAMRVASETGGGLAETLERTSSTIRSRLQMEGKIRALTAQGKLQAIVVGLLPLLLMLILNYMEPQAMALLWHSRAGWATLAVLVILEFMGIYVIRKIIAIDV